MYDDMSDENVGSGKDCVVSVSVERTETFGVDEGLELVDDFEVGEVVNVSFFF